MMRRYLKYVVSIGVIIVVAFCFVLYNLLFGLNVRPLYGKSTLFIPSGASYRQVLDSIGTSLEVKNRNILEWVAGKKNYPRMVKPGRYVFEKPLNYNGLINILRSGRQTPVRITFNNARNLNDIAGRIGGQIEADSAQIITFFSDQENYNGDGFTPEDIISVFIPDTYEFFWNTGPGQLYTRMLEEYKKFWNSKRVDKSRDLGLTPKEVTILASIIEYESSKSDEKPRIAGVYLNRLKSGIPLQADPTIKFAVNDFTLTRILFKHLETDSRYNTYKYSGLPPGPICCPSAQSIEAVLNAEKHDYLYFVAKPDLSGYHNFSRTLAEHNRYASQYQRELNRRRIFR